MTTDPEFIAKAIQKRLRENEIKTIYIDPGCPWQNGYVESFNSRFRAECLNRELLYTLSESRVVFEDWRHYYNRERPHRSLDLQTPEEFAKEKRKQTQTGSHLLWAKSRGPTRVDAPTTSTKCFHPPVDRAAPMNWEESVLAVMPLTKQPPLARFVQRR